VRFAVPRDPVWTGVQKHGAGWRASVSRGRGRSPLQKHFPRETPPRVMQRWRADAKAQLRLTRKQRATKGSFAYDAARYLEAVKALTTYEARKRDIQRWVAIFGTRQRDSLTSAEIRAWRDRWMTEPRSEHGWVGPGRPQAYDQRAKHPYSASTINHWLRALSNLWTVLDGRRAPNPVRDVPEVTEPDALPRGRSYALIEQIIAAISDRGRPTKGQKNTTVALTKIRLRVLAYTGLTYAQLQRLTPADVDLEAGTMLVKRRSKGKGAKPRRLALLPQAVDAFRALDVAGGWGPFSGASVRKSFVLAYGKLRQADPSLPPMRVYDLRHSFGSLVFRATKSPHAVKHMLSHESVRTTERYTLEAVEDVLAAQLSSLPDALKSSQTIKPDGKS
jgi:integrase